MLILDQKVADYIHDVEDFGDLPPSLLLRLGQILSRRRAVTSKTLDLFLRPQYKTIDLFDCASKLRSETYAQDNTRFNNLQSWTRMIITGFSPPCRTSAE